MRNTVHAATQMQVPGQGPQLTTALDVVLSGGTHPRVSERFAKLVVKRYRHGLGRCKALPVREVRRVGVISVLVIEVGVTQQVP